MTSGSPHLARMPKCRKSLVYLQEQACTADVPVVPVDLVAPERERETTHGNEACLSKAMQVSRASALDTRSCGAVAQGQGERMSWDQRSRSDQ